MYTTQTDLLWAVRDSENRQAWGDFYRIYAPMLRSFAARLGVPDSDADDVAQEVLLIAHRSLRDSTYDPRRGRFRGWLYGIARNRALMARRARHRPTRAQVPQADGGADLLSGIEDKHEATQREIWEQEWRYAMLDAALHDLRQQLGEKVMQTFVLYALEQWPPEKVAASMNIETSSVYVYKSRVLNAVRHWIERFEDDGDPTA